MHGHGYAQPVKQPPPTGWLVFVRVLLVALSVLTIGLLAWILLLRLAIVTRKSLDWGLLVAAVAADVLSLVLMGTEPGDEIHTTGGWLGLALLFGTLIAAISYYLGGDTPLPPTALPGLRPAAAARVRLPRAPAVAVRRDERAAAPDEPDELDEPGAPDPVGRADTRAVPDAPAAAAPRARPDRPGARRTRRAQ